MWSLCEFLRFPESCSGFCLCFLASGPSPLSFMSLTSWMMKTSSPEEIGTFPLSDGAHRHLQVNKVRVQVTTLVTKVPASSNRMGFRFKVVGMQAGKLQGSSPYRGVSVGDNEFLWSKFISRKCLLGASKFSLPSLGHCGVFFIMKIMHAYDF